MEDSETSLATLVIEMKYLRQDVAELKVNVKEDVAEIKEDVKSLHGRPCPSLMCYGHEQRIGTLETYFKLLAGTFILVVIPLAAAVLGSIFS